MSNYNQTAIVGQSWTRSQRVVIENPFGFQPSVNFSEENIVLLENGQTIKTPGQGIYSHITSEMMEMDLPLRHPDTGEIIGSAKFKDVYVMLHSLYYKMANDRDNTPMPTIDEV